MEILRGLMVGSQGTLGFLAEFVFDTLPLHRRTSTGLFFFPSLSARRPQPCRASTRPAHCPWS